MIKVSPRDCPFLPLGPDESQRFNAMTQQCFEACVDDFTSKSLGSREESCINRCFEKMNNAESRAGSRFQEHMAAMNASNSLNN